MVENLTASWATHPNFWFLIGLGLAFLPAAAIGFFTHNWIKSRLFTPQTVGCLLDRRRPDYSRRRSTP